MRAIFTFTCCTLLACGPTPAGPDAASTTGDPPGTTSGDAEPTAPTTDSPATTTATTTTAASTTQSHDFISHFDLPPEPCDVWAQDCPPGQKCVPWARDSHTSWDALKCVDITGDAAPGDPCTAPAGPLAGLDDCALGSICQHVDADNHGTCIAQCTGTPDAPICAPVHQCIIANQGVLTLCEPWCDPIAQDCAFDRSCFAIDDAFLCIVPNPERTAKTNDPCEFVNACAKGLACLPPAAVSAACDPNAQGCCTPFCQLPDAPCPNPDQQCLPWYDPMQPVPPGYEDLGSCRIPD